MTATNDCVSTAGGEGGRPKVSIVVPVYNARDSVGRCLQSIFDQDFRDIEIIAVDDGSIDGSAEVLDEYARLHPGVLRVVHQKNGGVAKARNRGIGLATGKYLTFADNDDYFDPDCISTYVGVAEEGDYDVVIGGYRRPDADGRIRQTVVLDPAAEWSPFRVVAAWSKLFRTDYVQRNKFAFLPSNIGEDICFTLPATLMTSRRAVISYCGYNWFYNEQSVSNTSHKSSQGLQFEYMLDTLYADLRERGIEMDELLVHYFVRLVAWFVFYTCPGDGGAEAVRNYQRCMEWLDENVPAWRDDPLARATRPEGDTQMTRVATWLFVRHPRLECGLLRLYGLVG